MPIPKKYIHDRIVLLLLSINAFLTLLGALLVILKLGDVHTSSFIVQRRFNLPKVEQFTKGNSTPILSFIFFSVLIFVLHTVLSIKTYHLRRHFAITILGLGTLLLIISVIVSNALLVYR